MQSKHTPGPWDYDAYGEHFSFYGKDGREEYTFRVEFCDDMTEEETLSNVHLIAAAPELLAGIHEIMKDAADCPETLEEACLGLIVCKCRKLIEKVNT